MAVAEQYVTKAELDEALIGLKDEIAKMFAEQTTHIEHLLDEQTKQVLGALGESQAMGG